MTAAEALARARRELARQGGKAAQAKLSPAERKRRARALAQKAADSRRSGPDYGLHRLPSGRVRVVVGGRYLGVHAEPEARRIRDEALAALRGGR